MRARTCNRRPRQAKGRGPAPRVALGVVMLMASTLLALAGRLELAVAGDFCGTTGGHRICVSAVDTDPSDADLDLVGTTALTVTNSPNAGKLYFTWLPNGRPSVAILLDYERAPLTQDYSFVWPTQKYLDATGVLRIQRTPADAPVDIPITLANGNVKTTQLTPADWQKPPAYTGAGDPIIAAVGDAASGEKGPEALASMIASTNPALFLYLGDVYATGGSVEERNHYGLSALDNPANATAWGKMANITQPTLGNHEAAVLAEWRDYWHQRPTYTYFDLAGVRIFDLNSSASFASGGAQYNFVQSNLPGGANPPPGPCVVAYWHVPALKGTKVAGGKLPMWSLLANAGGDLVLNGHIHTMAAYKPLDATMTSTDPAAGAHMVELISGAGGHTLGNIGTTDDRIAFSKPNTIGALSLTLNGGGSGGLATSIDWVYQTQAGAVIQDSSGHVDC